MKRPKKFKIKKRRFELSPNGFSFVKRNPIKQKKIKREQRIYRNGVIVMRQSLSSLKRYFSIQFFPHISRLFPARIFRLVLLASFAALICGFLVVNVLLPAKLLRFQSRILADYKNPLFHLQLADRFLENNNLKEAQQELLLGLSVSPGSSLLEEKLKFVEVLINRPQNIASEIRKWELVVNERPNFRDGYFQLAVCYYQLFNVEGARKNTLKALELDPNFIPAQQLLKLISG
jgi:hypothetical protein